MNVVPNYEKETSLQFVPFNEIVSESEYHEAFKTNMQVCALGNSNMTAQKIADVLLSCNPPVSPIAVTKKPQVNSFEHYGRGKSVVLITSATQNHLVSVLEAALDNTDPNIYSNTFFRKTLQQTIECITTHSLIDETDDQNHQSVFMDSMSLKMICSILRMLETQFTLSRQQYGMFGGASRSLISGISELIVELEALPTISSDYIFMKR